MTRIFITIGLFCLIATCSMMVYAQGKHLDTIQQESVEPMALFVSKTAIDASESLEVVVEISNNTESRLRLPSNATLVRERAVPEGVTRAEKVVDREFPSDPKQVVLGIRSEVKAQKGADATHLDLATVRRRAPNDAEVAPGESGFVVLDLPASMFTPGTCTLTATAQLEEGYSAETQKLTVRVRNVEVEGKGGGKGEGR